jgi:hypothetical protein
MTYALGGLIQASDYNGFATNVNSVWTTLYGQPTIAPVTVGQIVTAQQWNSIYTATSNAAQHQGTTITSIIPAGVGGAVKYYSQLPTNITAISSNPYNCSATGTDITVSGVRTAPWGGAVSIPTVISTITMTFDSVDKLHYFFNTGGTFRISCSSGAGSGSAADILWTTLTSGMGTLSMPALSTPQTIVGTSYTGLKQIGGTITPSILVASGFYNLTATPTKLFELFSGGSYGYGTDSISIVYSTVGSSLIATVLFENTNNSTIDGTLTVFATARPSEATYIANTWGTPTITVTAPVTL